MLNSSLSILPPCVSGLNLFFLHVSFMHVSNAKDTSRWPRLGAWYEAMDSKVPAYSARVRGDEESWRKVLAQA